jgi:hypothetical protein
MNKETLKIQRKNYNNKKLNVRKGRGIVTCKSDYSFVGAYYEDCFSPFTTEENQSIYHSFVIDI